MTSVQVAFDGPVHECPGCRDDAICDAETEGSMAALALLSRLMPVSIRTARDPMRVAEWLGLRGFDCRVDMGIARDLRTSWDERGFLLVTDAELPGIHLERGEGIQPGYWQAALSAIGAASGPELQQEAALIAAGAA